ncbi:uncharacterized protein LOC111250920 isoform X1 [Varroa destructor]|uniref:C3H1-type domain-containing protein n=1 Tax=Varroa destructor TaxID=109461 RepID=A0A7M7K7F5_VARDE|nr:uncharacterized protein LOC111250920 isoform X1 [Varroa destructor]XP_022662632.1 uncharacterized protein LOC111250920 isoform X1 [Varroa destructor]XP_022662633.1 uncharacterized protein LOC111250920 isoform X1 [Varroa destructor]XP_022662634.1 uncharacterized protein LOC111250920 isoform X1 [Varroa destructor]XP_022662635.1 uncharacterized protein LOC111250920 isoform X1 [Varroa destructor]XP_022662636.1 uncharacterized protein LOC111250920 isoform X1 [Varroa destructor]XP_022662637.1 un
MARLAVPAPDDLSHREFTLAPSDVTVENDPFALRFSPDSQKKETVAKAINSLCAKFKDDDCSDDPSKWCAVRQSSGLWLRAEVLACYSDEDNFVNSAEVQHIDEGFKEIVDITNIFPLDQSLLAYPPQSIRVIPDQVIVKDVTKLVQLFNEYPDMKIRIRIKNTKGKSDRPYFMALKSSFEIGHEEFIDFGELCEKLNIGYRIKAQNTAAVTVNSDDNDVVSVEKLPEGLANSETGNKNNVEDVKPPSVVSTESDTSMVFENTDMCTNAETTSGRKKSSDDSDSSAVVSPKRCETPKENAGGADECLELSQQGVNWMVRRNMQQASRINERTERKIKTCISFLRFGMCAVGNNCPNSHDLTSENTVVRGRNRFIYECLSIELHQRSIMFVMISHLNEDFYFYVVPVYGTQDIWSVLEQKHLAAINVEEIQTRLYEFYGPQREGMVPRAGLLIGQMVSVYVNENQGPSGWHRGKLLEMDASNNQYKIFLIDHGGEVWVPTSNAFSLEPKFLEWPTQAIRVSLADVRLKKGVLVSDIIPCLIKHVYIMQVDERSTVDEYVVNLFSDDGVTSLAEALESKGFIEFLDEPYELMMH